MALSSSESNPFLARALTELAKILSVNVSGPSGPFSLT